MGFVKFRNVVILARERQTVIENNQNRSERQPRTAAASTSLAPERRDSLTGARNIRAVTVSEHWTVTAYVGHSLITSSALWSTIRTNFLLCKTENVQEGIAQRRCSESSLLE
jgi:hypothetical protein